MKQSLFLITAVAVAGMAFNAFPALAALTYQVGGAKYGVTEHFNTYITATGNDTTDPVNGKVIDNRDGRVEFINAIFSATNQTGSSPTVNLILQGSNDGTNWYNLQSGQSTPATMQTGATSIATASTTTVVAGFSSDQFQRHGGFPAFIRLQVDLGGSTPGWTGGVALLIKRAP